MVPVLRHSQKWTVIDKYHDTAMRHSFSQPKQLFYKIFAVKGRNGKSSRISRSHCHVVWPNDDYRPKSCLGQAAYNG